MFGIGALDWSFGNPLNNYLDSVRRNREDCFWKTITSPYVPCLDQLTTQDDKIAMYNDIAYALLKCKRENKQVAYVAIPQKYGDETVEVLKEYGYKARVEMNNADLQKGEVYLVLAGW